MLLWLASPSTLLPYRIDIKEEKMPKLADIELTVYHKIRSAIWKKELLPNAQLVEATLAEKLGVSRTPIRTALKKLSYEGLVNIISSKGAFVAQPSIEEMIQVFSCRLLIEKETAALAAKAISVKDLTYLEKLLEKQHKIYTTNKDFESFLDNNLEFHTLIAHNCQNKYYLKYVEELVIKSNLYLIYFDQFHSTNPEESATLREHTKIITALKEKNAEESGKAMYTHIQTMYRNLLGSMVEQLGPTLSKY